ncbi:peptide chain release factor N(5)-glutamine methyltransferase [Candidatus Peregrinibacteria bacterium]|nr:peptide chain release factor N(5)-glutamine methyltransferase [Candidatus Peregrinibacteria bacterium]
MTIKQLLAEGIRFLDERENSLLDCELLLAHVLGEEKEYLIRNAEQEVEDSLVELFKRYLNSLKDGEPLAYIVNAKEFFGINFYVDKRVLIPRPETEHLVEKVLEYLSANFDGETLSVLDVGTGSGNIAISVASHFADVEMEAVDIEEDALEVARINAEQSGVDDRISFYQSDLLQAVDGNFVVIVANLPYIGERRHRYVSAATEKYEPHSALFGGENGLTLYERMFCELLEKDLDFKYLIGEFGFAQAEEMSKLLDEYFVGKWTIERDLAGIERLFVVKNI